MLQYPPACQTPSLQTFSFCWHFIRKHFENPFDLKYMHFETQSLWKAFSNSLLVLDRKFILHLLTLVFVHLNNTKALKGNSMSTLEPCYSPSNSYIDDTAELRTLGPPKSIPLQGHGIWVLGWDIKFIQTPCCRTKKSYRLYYEFKKHVDFRRKRSWSSS